MEPITLEFEITHGEYVEAVRVLRRKPKDWYRPLRIGGLACATIGSAILFADQTHWIAPTLLVIFGLFVPIYPVFRFNQEREKGWDKYSRIGPVVLEISDDVVSFRCDAWGAWWSWQACERLTETTKVFLLHRNNEPQLIPKRAFTDTAQISEFRSFVQHKLSRPTGGFPISPNARDAQAE